MYAERRDLQSLRNRRIVSTLLRAFSAHTHALIALVIETLDG